MSATLVDAITFGDNAARGPLYNKTISLTAGTYTLVLPVNPARKFLLIKPRSNHVHIHFLTPGALAATITDANSFTINSNNSDQPLIFATFVPTNAVYAKMNTGNTELIVFES
jgi:hypothetical protein